jgi:hypothetical protein
MPSYDRSLNPPGPVASVRISHPATGAGRGPFAGKLDTGADVTVIPAEIPDELGLTPWGWTRATGFDGSSSTRLIYYVDCRLKGFASQASAA